MKGSIATVPGLGWGCLVGGRGGEEETGVIILLITILSKLPNSLIFPPAECQGSDFSTSSPTLVIVCLSYSSHGGGAVSGISLWV